MTITTLLILAGVALAYRLLFRNLGRGWALLALSTLALYWLQPAVPVRQMDFWLPTLTLGLVMLSWAVTRAAASQSETRVSFSSFIKNENFLAGLVICGIALLVALTRYLSLTGVITPTRPPQTLPVLIALALIALLVFAAGKLKSHPAALWALFALLLGLFIVLKLPALSQVVSAGLRALMEQDPTLATSLDLRWLGYSYIAFRLIHTIRDRQAKRLPACSLMEYANYVLFFPAIAAGPIDRLDRFLKDLRKPLAWDWNEMGEGGKRLAVGLFKKFVVADFLAIIALSAQNAEQIRTAGWMWVALYAYALQIYFDFSGYTDIAIGIGRWLGFTLPENFNHPYLKPNLTQFWNNWHMTLTMWFRAYFFNPITRALRSGKRALPVWSILLITQVSTMVLIGLWHGITWNFVCWGLWHGLGQFVQNRYSEWIKPRAARLDGHPRWKSAVTVCSTFLTFNYVALGWIWFALPSIPLSLHVFARLFGG